MAFLLGIGFLVGLAMLGLGIGVILRKRTPLRGSCRGIACEKYAAGTCSCGSGSGARDE